MKSKLFFILLYTFASYENKTILEKKQDKGMSIINKIDRNRPRIDPWGFPERADNHSDV